MSGEKKLQIKRSKLLIASQENTSKGNIFSFECVFSVLFLLECLAVSAASNQVKQGQI